MQADTNTNTKVNVNVPLKTDYSATSRTYIISSRTVSAH